MCISPEQPAPSRRQIIAGTLGGAAALLLLSGCGSTAPAGSSAAGTETRHVRIGTMPTEDFLPGWIAAEDGLFDRALRVDIQTFQSAQELTAAMTAGELDLALTDPQVAATLSAAGTEVALRWIALGATPAEGRFGIQAGAGSDVASLADLRGKQIAVGSNTVPEYVMDRLLGHAGIGLDEIEKVEVKKLPVRFQMMAAGQVAAAALPASLIALGELEGCRTVADDTAGENLSQSVIVERLEADGSGALGDALELVRDGWMRGVDAVNADPERYRALLVSAASLPKSLAETYPIPTYPTDAAPTAELIQPQLDWMRMKRYLADSLSFDEETGRFTA